MSEAKQGGAGVFAKIVQKRISRAQEKVLQKLGRTIETKDEMFEQCAYNFSRQQNEGNRLYKDLKAVFGAVKAMHESSRKLSETLHVIYRPEWDGYNDLRAIVENDDLLWNDYEEKLSGQVVRTMENYMAQFPEMKERIAKRGRKMVDYDSARHHLETLQNAKKKDEAKITKAEEEFNKAQMVFEDLNKELREDLPVLYSSRIGCYVNIFQNISNLRDVFFKEMSKLNHELYDVMSKLEKQHSNKVFVIKGLKSNRKSLVISSPISSTSSFFMASVDPAVNNPVNKADSIDQTYDISSVSSHSSETQDSNSMDGTSWKSSQEVTVDLAQGSPDDLSQRPSDKPVLKISEEFKQEDTLDTIEKPSMASVEMDEIQMDPEDSKESDLEGQTKTNSGDTIQGGPEDVVKGDSGSTTAEGIDQITERSSGVTEQEESKESSHGKSGDAMQTRSDNTTPYKEKDPKDTAQLDTCEIMQCDSDDTTKGNSSMETTGGSREVIQCGAVDMTQVNTRHAEEEDLLHPTWKEPGGMQQGQLVNMAYLDDSEFRLHEAIKTMAMEPTTVQILETSKNTSEGISEDLENTNVPEANMCLETTNNNTAGPLSHAAENRCLCVCDEGDLNQNVVSSLQTQIDSDISSMRQKTNQSNDLDTAGSNPPGPSSEEEGSCISATTDKNQEAQMETGADKDQSTSSQHEELLEGTKNEDYQEHLSLTEKKPT